MDKVQPDWQLNKDPSEQQEEKKSVASSDVTWVSIADQVKLISVLWGTTVSYIMSCVVCVWLQKRSA